MTNLNSVLVLFAIQQEPYQKCILTGPVTNFSHVLDVLRRNCNIMAEKRLNLFD